MPANASRPQFLRRDFLFGSAAGLAATGVAGLPRAFRPPYPEGVNPSYAQSGEDVVVAALFDFLKIGKPTYLDVGAYLPIFSNNTYLFYKKGGRGVLVEPNVDLISELRTKRPGDTVLNVGIGVTEQDAAEYYCMTLPQWNTFDKEEAERRVAKTGGKVEIVRVVKMPLVPINRIISEHFPRVGPDFLSIDIESLDLAVLRTLDFSRSRPKVICTETLIPLTARMDPEITRFLDSQGYEARGMTFANTVYIDRSLLGSSSV